jgi:acetyl esterase/lipase
MHDAQRAMRVIRSHAAAWGVDENAVGVIGFSAGGHLAAMLSTRADDWPCADDDLRDRVSARPNAVVLAYAALDFVAHKSARFPLPVFGDVPNEQLIRDLSPLHFVSADTPPTYLWHTAGDEVVPVANSLLYAQACQHWGVPYELHVPELGKHGQSMWDGEYIHSPQKSPLNEGMLAFLHRHLVSGGVESERSAGA